MTNIKQSLLLVLIGELIVVSIFMLVKKQDVVVNVPAQENQQVAPVQFGAVTNYLDTSASSITFATSTVNTTATQVFASLTKMGQIITTSTQPMTCSLDQTNTTAASSTLVNGRGIIVVATTSTIPYVITFGECYPGSVNCYTHKGAVNCLAAGGATQIVKWSK